MNRYALLKDSINDTIFGVVVDSNGLSKFHGVSAKGIEWAKWANGISVKSENSGLPIGVVVGGYSTLRNTSPNYVQALVDTVSLRNPSINKKQGISDSLIKNSSSIVPSVRDAELRAFDIDKRNEAIAFKARAFRTDSKVSSLLTQVRAERLGFVSAEGVFSSRNPIHTPEVKQAEIIDSYGRSLQRAIGLSLIRKKSAKMLAVVRKDQALAKSFGLEVKAAGIGPKIGSRLSGGLRAAPAGMSFVDVTGVTDADTDGIVFEGKPGLERPIIPRFMVPKELARKLSGIVEGDAEAIEKQRRAGNTSVQFDEGKLRNIVASVGGDASLLQAVNNDRGVPATTTSGRERVSVAARNVAGNIGSRRREIASRRGMRSRDDALLDDYFRGEIERMSDRDRNNLLGRYEGEEFSGAESIGDFNPTESGAVSLLRRDRLEARGGNDFGDPKPLSSSELQKLSESELVNRLIEDRYAGLTLEDAAEKYGLKGGRAEARRLEAREMSRRDSGMRSRINTIEGIGTTEPYRRQLAERAAEITGKEPVLNGRLLRISRLVSYEPGKQGHEDMANEIANHVAETRDAIYDAVLSGDIDTEEANDYIYEMFDNLESSLKEVFGVEDRGGVWSDMTTPAQQKFEEDFASDAAKRFERAAANAESMRNLKEQGIYSDAAHGPSMFEPRQGEDLIDESDKYLDQELSDLRNWSEDNPLADAGEAWDRWADEVRKETGYLEDASLNEHVDTFLREEETDFLNAAYRNQQQHLGSRADAVMRGVGMRSRGYRNDDDSDYGDDDYGVDRGDWDDDLDPDERRRIMDGMRSRGRKTLTDEQVTNITNRLNALESARESGDEEAQKELLKKIFNGTGYKVEEIEERSGKKVWVKKSKVLGKEGDRYSADKEITDEELTDFLRDQYISDIHDEIIESYRANGETFYEDDNIDYLLDDYLEYVSLYDRAVEILDEENDGEFDYPQTFEELAEILKSEDFLSHQIDMQIRLRKNKLKTNEKNLKWNEENGMRSRSGGMRSNYENPDNQIHMTSRELNAVDDRLSNIIESGRGGFNAEEENALNDFKDSIDNAGAAYDSIVLDNDVRDTLIELFGNIANNGDDPNGDAKILLGLLESVRDADGNEFVTDELDKLGTMHDMNFDDSAMRAPGGVRRAMRRAMSNRRSRNDRGMRSRVTPDDITDDEIDDFYNEIDENGNKKEILDEIFGPMTSEDSAYIRGNDWGFEASGLRGSERGYRPSEEDIEDEWYEGNWDVLSENDHALVREFIAKRKNKDIQNMQAENWDDLSSDVQDRRFDDAFERMFDEEPPSWDELTAHWRAEGRGRRDGSVSPIQREREKWNSHAEGSGRRDGSVSSEEYRATLDKWEQLKEAYSQRKSQARKKAMEEAKKQFEDEVKKYGPGGMRSSTGTEQRPYENVPVTGSSALRQASYNEDKKELVVTYANGKTYTYKNFSNNDLENALSGPDYSLTGTAINKIKKTHDFQEGGVHTFDPEYQDIQGPGERIGTRKLSRVGRGGKTQIPVNGSSGIEALTWDDDKNDLIVTYKGGRTYTYKDVDPYWIDDLEQETGTGRIVNNIKNGGYDFVPGGEHGDMPSEGLTTERARFGMRSQSGVISGDRFLYQDDVSRVGRGGKTRVNIGNSQAVSAITWDDNNRDLIVTFGSGRTYTYLGVDDDLIKDLEENPDSVGKIINKIKNSRVPYEEGGDHAPLSTLSSEIQQQREMLGMRSRMAPSSGRIRAAEMEISARPQGMASRRSEGLRDPRYAVPGRDRVDPSDGQLWNRLSDEEKETVANRAVNREKMLLNEFKQRFPRWWDRASKEADKKGWDKDLMKGGNAGWLDELHRFVTKLADDPDYPEKSRADAEKQFNDLQALFNMRVNRGSHDLLEHLNPTSRRYLFDDARRDDSKKTGISASGKEMKTPSTAPRPFGDPVDVGTPIREQVGQNQKKPLKERLDSYYKRMSDKVLYSDPARQARREMRKARRQGINAGGFTESEANPVDDAKRKIRRRKRLKQMRKNRTRDINTLSDSSTNNRVDGRLAHTDSQGSLVFGDKLTSTLSTMMQNYRTEAKLKKTKGSVNKNRALAVLWDGAGYNGTPNIITPDEFKALHAAGWVPVVRGHGQGSNGVRYANDWIDDPVRFITGQGGEAQGEGEYWARATQGGGGWFSWMDGSLPAGTVGLLPPSTRRVSKAELRKIQSDHAPLAKAIKSFDVGLPTGEREKMDAEEYVGQLRDHLRTSLGSAYDSTMSTKIGQMTSKILDSLSGSSDSKKQELLDSLEFLELISKKRTANAYAPLLGYDTIIADSGVELIHNRTAVAIVGDTFKRDDAVNLAKSKA